MNWWQRYSSVLVLIGVNLIPVIGVLFWNWGSNISLFLYWMESLVIGFFNIIKICFSNKTELEGNFYIKGLQTVWLVLFFTFHYFLFCLFQGGTVFFLSFFNLQALTGVRLFVGYITEQLEPYRLTLIWSFSLIFVSHAYSLVTNFFLKGEYKDSSISRLMVQPYLRIWVVQLTIIFGYALGLYLGQTRGLAIVLVLLKLVADVFSHLRERKEYRVG